MKRRDFNKNLLSTITSFALMDSLFAADAFGRNIRPIAAHWAVQLNEFCSDLKTNSISTLEWQEKVGELFAQVRLEDILKFIDFEKLVRVFDYPDLGVSTKPVRFPELSGLPPNTVFAKKIFGMKKDRAIIPHGHSNMASAHLVLKGEMHLRHYEKISKEGRSLIIKPSIDRIAKTGESSSISDDKDNVHWFIADSETAFTFDVIMLDLNNQKYDIHNLDIYESVDLGNGTIKVPMLDVDTALKKYGKQHH